MFDFPYKVRLRLRGMMPERALLRLHRAKISIFNAVKIARDEIRFSVWKKDIEKVFAIYPNICYNIGEYSPYTVEKLGAVGIGKLLESAKNRAGLWIGCLAFATVLTLVNECAFGVRFVGTSVYAREAYMALEECGIGFGKRYRGQNADLFCAKMLALDGVEYCSLKKEGLKLRVEVRLSPFQTTEFAKGGMQAKHTGTLIGITVLRGTALKKLGESVSAGEMLVGDWFCTEAGEQVRVELIARVRIACTYEAEIAATDAEEAFAQAYLEIGLGAEDTLQSRAAAKAENGYLVTLRYIATERMNI